MTDWIARRVLEQFLLSDSTPLDSMGLSELDGFLTGIIAGPVTMAEHEWMPLLWGSGTPRYRSAEQRLHVHDALARRYAEISQALSGSPDDALAIYIESSDDIIIIASSWAGGFLQAMEMRPEAWLPLIQDERPSIFLIPIFSLYREAEEHDLPFAPNLQHAIVSAATKLIPACAYGIRQFWGKATEVNRPILRSTDVPDPRPKPTAKSGFSRDKTCLLFKRVPERAKSWGQL
jgi:uncharacterized protein